jgi:hypothetical protein
VRAGEQVNLGIPSLGLFYLLQAYPFSITWWEDNVKEEVELISLMFYAYNGFIRKLLQHVEPDYDIRPGLIVYLVLLQSTIADPQKR